MPDFSGPERRRSTRMISKGRPVSMVIKLDRKPKKLRCVVVDYSKGGFRLRGTVRLIKRDQVVELIFDKDMPPNPVRCRVVWVGKAGSKKEGHVGVETV